MVVAVASVVALSPARPAAADFPYPIDCDRDIVLEPVFQSEGTWSTHELGFTWFPFTVRADGCILTGATVVFKTEHLTTNDDDLIPVEGVTVTWGVGDRTTRTVYVRVYKDSTVERNEQFMLKVVCPLSTGISAGVATEGRILNDDGETLSGELVPYNYHCRQ